MSERLKQNFYLVLVVIFAVFIRVIFYWHGYPFIFHPDEPTVVRGALEIRFYPNPGHFDWPHLFIYLNYFVYMVFAKFREFAATYNWFRGTVFYDDNLVFYYISRIFEGILGGLTVIPIFLSAKELFKSRKAALVSACVFAVIPLHVWNSHLALIDVPMIFFFSWVLFFSSKIFTSGKLRFYILAGLFTGLAAATKYHGAFGALMIMLAHFLDFHTVEAQLSKFYKLVVAGIVSVLGFVLAMPYALLDFETFTRTDGPKGALWQFSNVGHVPLDAQLIKFIYNIFIRIPDDVGYTFAALTIAGFVYFLVKKKFSKVLFFVYVMFLFLVFYISGFEKSRSHYLMISYPFIALASGFVIYKLHEVLQSRIIAFKLLVFVIFAIPITFTAYQAYMLNNDDTRVQLYKYLAQNDKVLYFYSSNSLSDVLGKSAVAHQRTQEFNYSGIPYTYYIVAEESRVDVAAKLLMLPENVAPVIEFAPINRKGPIITVVKSL